MKTVWLSRPTRNTPNNENWRIPAASWLNYQRARLKLRLSMEQNRQLCTPTSICLIDMGTALNSINATFIKSQLSSSVERRCTPVLRKANKQLLPFMGTILTHVPTEEPCVWTLYSIVDNLGIDTVLGAFLIDRYIQKVLSGDRKLVQWHSTPKIIINSPSVSWPSLETAKEQEEPDFSMSAPFDVSKRVPIASDVQQAAKARTSLYRLVNTTNICLEETFHERELSPLTASLPLFTNDRFITFSAFYTIRQQYLINEKQF